MFQPEDLHLLHQTSFSVFQDVEAQKELSASNDDLSEGNAAKVSRGTPHKQTNKQTITEPVVSNGSVRWPQSIFQEKNIFSNMFKKPQKPAEGTAAEKVLRFDPVTGN